MGPRGFRSLLTVGALLVATLALPALASGSASAAPASCSTSSGVLVVVDFRHFGGSLTRGCDPSPTTGFAALHDAGYTTDGTVHDGEGFVCRVDGHPNKNQDPCYNTPPATAYWSYWHANAGQSSWSYSSLGAQSYHPKPGSVDAWVFGSTDVAGTSGGPSFTPSEARGQRSGGSGSGGTGSGGAGSGGAGSGGGAGTGAARSSTSRPAASHSADTTRGATPVPSATTHAPTSAHRSATSATAPSSAAVGVTASPSAPGAGSSAPPSAAPSFADASSVAHKTSSSSGSALPVILGIALVLLLGAGGGWGVLRRRRADAAEH